MKVASYLPKENQPRTARTWAIHGYVVNDGVTGEVMDNLDGIITFVRIKEEGGGE